jgi:succinate dehydrogenase/fumarate reductase flavoprotein subunit
MATWDSEFDLVVVGYGGAGAVTAITAADAGAQVLIVEKQAANRHTPSTRMASIVMAVNDADAATTYFDRCAGGMIPRAVSRAWAERAGALPGWFERVGVAVELHRIRGAQHPEFEGSASVDVYLATRPGSDVRIEQRVELNGVPLAASSARPRSSDYFDALRQAVQARERVTVLFDSPARRLVRQADGHVDGVEVDSQQRTLRIHGRKGVVLTCGGFEYDTQMKLNYLKAAPVHFYGNPDNNGDGVRMAQAAGADLWHMNQMIGRGIAHFEPTPGAELNFIVHLFPPGYVITDRFGRRFANELEQAAVIEHTFYYHLLEYDVERNTYVRIPCFWFFDQRRADVGPIVGPYLGGIGEDIYHWSRDNQAEVARGWISVADSVRGAAAKAGVEDPVAAEAAVQAYNVGCRVGQDAFGRPQETLVPLEAPPFYCVPLYPGGSNTCGGPRRNARAQILDPFGDPIAGLYAAGELGQPVGLLYPSSGSNLSEAICFGQIAAETALGAVSG